ncbi:MAG: cell division protein FtsA [Abditibacteriota bacterium]|nr:cell division protein FtsA [Abditibacteriota bacterium]
MIDNAPHCRTILAGREEAIESTFVSEAISNSVSNFSHRSEESIVPQDDIVVGLDIGTTKVCTVVGHGEPRGKITIAGVGTVPSRGIKKGVVIDVEDTVTAIRESVERARHMAGVDFHLAVAGITGDHIQSSNRRGTVTVAGPPGAAEGIITSDDVARALQAAAMDVPADREIIHSLPRFFAVDGHRGVRRPIGMCGTRLEVETHVVTGTASFLQNVVQCVERAGLGVEALVLEPIATSESVATADERELGVALIDIGGGTSDIAVFMDGSIVHSAVLPVGGNHVTRDISIGLRTPFEHAERLKIESGVASPGLIPHGEALEVMTAGSGERLRLPRAILGEIIEARMSELLEMAKAAINGAGPIRLPAGVVLTGGGAMLPGAIELASEIFEMPVRLGKPIELNGWGDQVDTPQFATAVGLLRFALRQREAIGNPAVGSQATYASHDGQRRVWSMPARLAESDATSNGTAASTPQNGNGLSGPNGSATFAQNGPNPSQTPSQLGQPAVTGARTTMAQAHQPDANGVQASDNANGEGSDLDTPFDHFNTEHASGDDSDKPVRPSVWNDSQRYDDEAPMTIWQKFFLKLRQLIGFEPS